VYLAARFSRQPELLEYKAALEAHGSFERGAHE
jgi:hypothetical protein